MFSLFSYIFIFSQILTIEPKLLILYVRNTRLAYRSEKVVRVPQILLYIVGLNRCMYLPVLGALFEQSSE